MLEEVNLFEVSFYSFQQNAYISNDTDDWHIRSLYNY